MAGTKNRIPTHRLNFESLSLPGVSGQPSTSQNIRMNFALDDETDITLPSRFFFEDSRTATGTRHELFFLEQGPDSPSPSDSVFGDRFSGCPENGLTNLECQRKHGVAALGIIAPCIKRDNDPSCRAAISRAAAMGIEGMAFRVSTGAP